MALRIELVIGDITVMSVDAVVNAANHLLVGGGGVDGAIHEAAGEAAVDEACRVLGGCEPGDAKATPGFALPARWIIHTVGPIWRGGQNGERGILSSCYRRSLEVADELGARSVAFPAISTGAYGFPPEIVAEVAVTSLRTTPTKVSQALLVAFDRQTGALYRRQLLR